MKYFIQFLTYFRIIAGPIIFILILIPQSYGAALAILLLASVSENWAAISSNVIVFILAAAR